MTDTLVLQEAASALNVEEKEEDGDVMEKIIHHIGEMGTYQLLLVVFMLPFIATWAFSYAVPMFILATPQEHWCKVPELQNLTLEMRRNLSIPFTDEPPGWDRCQMFAANYTEVLATLTRPANDTPLIPCRNGWEFLFNDIPYSTIINEREWVCERASYAPFSQSMYFAGSLLGVTFFGWLGDTYGRLPAFIGANIMGLIGNIATIFTVGRWDFAIARLVAGTANDACYLMMYLIILEFIGSRHRTWVSSAAGVLGGAGPLMLTPVLALWLKNWRTVVVATTAPGLLALVTPWIVPESVRWLASNGKVNRAVAILKRFERINKKEIPEDVLNEFIISSNNKRMTDESLLALLRSPKLRKCVIVLIVVTIVGGVGIDAVVRMSESIGSDFFVTFAISSFAEVPALALITVTLDRFGRRAVIATTLAIGSVFSFICAFVPRGLTQALIAVTVRLFVNMAISGSAQLAPELLPTPVRSSGNSFIHVTAYMATILSPFIVYSSTIWLPMPLVTIGVLSSVGALCSLLLPETKGQPMPQTIMDGERLVAANMLCGKAEFDDEPEELPTLKEKI
ncbi:organic cation transporter protein [Amyelois transitella]|uniref:organic cation transporter protein n=1 Tax=Amyelois transitella TaxID=680683 RepID=UPI00299030F5|nr:organic cation transporter protein [Amyelois transitella]